MTPTSGVVVYFRVMEGTLHPGQDREDDGLRRPVQPGGDRPSAAHQAGALQAASPPARSAISPPPSRTSRTPRWATPSPPWKTPLTSPCPAIAPPGAMVYCGIYTEDGSKYPDLRDALEKLQLNDASLSFEPETSAALGFGFRCGFLGMLHMEIIQERLEREFDLDLVTTLPNVIYEVTKTDGTEVTRGQPPQLPRPLRHRGGSGSRSSRSPSSPPRTTSATSCRMCQERRGELQGHAVSRHQPGRDPLSHAPRTRLSMTSSTP